MSAAPSLGALLRESCRDHAKGTAMLVPKAKGFSEISYGELYELVRRWASGVRSLALARGDRLCILSENCVEWALLDWACQTLGIVAVPIYPTLPAEQARYIVENCGAKVVACGEAGQLAKVEGMEGVRTFLLRGESPAPGAARSLETIASEAALITDAEWDAAIDAIQPDDIATIIYTSGTTGQPKGVVLLHRNFVWSCEAVGREIHVDSNDTFMSFLPLSHIYSRAHDHFLPISLGATIAYSRGIAALANDILLARPTVILCVPRFLEATMGRIQEAANKEGGTKLKLFNLAQTQGIKKAVGHFAPLFWLTDRLVCVKIRARLGGRLRFMASAGAALPRHVYDFYAGFGFKLLQGYGLTETTGAVCVNNPALPIRGDTVGEMLGGVECRIAEDGEIFVRGGPIMPGYYNLPEETAKVLDRDGWFATGDIGRFEGEHLKITDRKKDLLVLGNGKNVAPQPIENALRASPLISEVVVLGDGMDACVALIVPDFAALRALLEPLPRKPELVTLSDPELGGGESKGPVMGGAELAPSLPKGEGVTDAEIIDLPEAKKAIKAEVDRLNKTLPSYEMVKRHALLATPFTVESGELTPTLKVKRKVVLERHAELVRSLG